MVGKNRPLDAEVGQPDSFLDYSAEGHAANASTGRFHASNY